MSYDEAGEDHCQQSSYPPANHPSLLADTDTRRRFLWPVGARLDSANQARQPLSLPPSRACSCSRAWLPQVNWTSSAGRPEAVGCRAAGSWATG
jgi:hypothetical protein